MGYFTLYNDTYDHQAGNDCLPNVAGAIQGAVKRKADLVARYGGEEFVVILPCTSTTQAVYIAELIRQGVRGLNIPHRSSPVSSCITVRLGVASIVSTAQELPSRLIQAADAALYQAKSSGRDAICACSSATLSQFAQ